MKRKAADDAFLTADAIRCFWLNSGDGTPYLCIEDVSTGDIFMRLIDMKGIFDQNYSRKLASLRYRAVSIAPDSTLAKQGHVTLYWQQAHEATHEVKASIRGFMGDDRAQQGHLRVVLLPIVYNAMAANDHLHTHSLYLKFLEILPSTKYWPLLKHAAAVTLDEQPAAPGALFAGPRDVATTCAKHMTKTASEDGDGPAGPGSSVGAGLFQMGAGGGAGAGAGNLVAPQAKRLATGPGPANLGLTGTGAGPGAGKMPSSAPVGANLPTYTAGLRAIVGEPSPLEGKDPHLIAAVMSLEREVRGMRGDLDTSLAVLLAEMLTVKRVLFELLTEAQRKGMIDRGYNLQSATKFGGSGVPGAGAGAGAGPSTTGVGAQPASALDQMFRNGRTHVEAEELMPKHVMDGVMQRVADNVGIPYAAMQSVPKPNGPNPFDSEKLGLPAMLLGLMTGAPASAFPMGEANLEQLLQGASGTLKKLQANLAESDSDPEGAGDGSDDEGSDL